MCAFIGLTTISAGFGGGESVGAARGDPMSLMGQRSPGARADGALAQSKPAYAMLPPTLSRMAPFRPTERVLSNVRSRPLLPGIEAPDLGSLFPGGISPLGDSIDTGPDTGIGSFPAEAFGSDFGGPGFTSIGGGGGGGGIGGGGIGGGVGGGGGGVIVPPGSIPAAVPEPATWLMMMLGFGIVGGALRRRRRAQSRLSCEASA